MAKDVGIGWEKVAQVWQQIAGGPPFLHRLGCVTKKQQSPLVSQGIINHRQDCPRWTCQDFPAVLLLSLERF